MEPGSPISPEPNSTIPSTCSSRAQPGQRFHQNRGAVITTTAGTSVTGVAAADFRQRITNRTFWSSAVPPGTVQLYLGNGDGTFQAPSTVTGIAVTIPPESPTSTTITNLLLRSVQVAAAFSFSLAMAPARFPDSRFLRRTGAGPPLAIGDFNHDGKPGIAYGLQGLSRKRRCFAAGHTAGNKNTDRSCALANFTSALYSSPSAMLTTMKALACRSCRVFRPGSVCFHGKQHDSTFQPAIYPEFAIPQRFRASRNINSDRHPGCCGVDCWPSGLTEYFYRHWPRPVRLTLLLSFLHAPLFRVFDALA